MRRLQKKIVSLINKYYRSLKMWTNLHEVVIPSSVTDK